jgi:hypothetical protein
VKPYNPDSPTEGQLELLAKLKDAEAAMLAFAEDWKYPMTLPRGPKKERAVLMLDYLLPDLQHILAVHFVSRGWRRHDDLAIIKPRKIVGGMFEDLVAYVPMDAPDAPIIVDHGSSSTPPPTLGAMPWSVTPTVTDVHEERPTDD